MSHPDLRRKVAIARRQPMVLRQTLVNISSLTMGIVTEKVKKIVKCMGLTQIW